MAIGAGAQKARVTLSRSVEDLVSVLNGEVDKITRCSDSSLNIALFADGRFGSFSTNKLDEASLMGFIQEAVKLVRSVAPDPCRDLPDPSRCCTDAITGDESGLLDPAYGGITPLMRREAAIAASVFGKAGGEGYELVSEEGEYSDSIYDVLVLDSNGLCCRHSENSFDYGVEATIQTPDGEKYSAYWWDSATRLSALDAASCGYKAVARAAAQIGSEPAPGGKYNMVIESEAASRVVSPLLRALNAYSIQQGNSFLKDSLGKRVFHEGMSIVDRPRIPGQGCSKYFDSEGVATSDAPIIENGVVRRYFVNTYMSRKTGFEPTTEDATRPVLLPYPHKGMGPDDILRMCGRGILVTEFNGGNSNSATGDFSYGISGFLFEDGKITRPVSGMLVTGNYITLWESLIAAGSDARPCMSKLIPTLAFANVDFSG